MSCSKCKNQPSISSCSSCAAKNPDACFTCGETWAKCCCELKAEDFSTCPGQCGITTISNLAKCSESQLNANKCTIVIKSEVFEKEDCATTPRKILLNAYNIVQTSTVCKDISEDWMEFFNDAVRRLNAEAEPLWEPLQAIVATCRFCEFNMPPNWNKIISVSNDVMACNSSCNTRRYDFVHSEQFIGSQLVNSWTIRNNTIAIKDPKSCGCEEAIPDFLMIDYYSKLPKAKTLDDCLNINDDAIMLLKDRIIADSLGVKYSNQLAIKRSLDNIEEYKNKNNGYVARRVQSSPFTKIYLGRRIR